MSRLALTALLLTSTASAAEPTPADLRDQSARCRRLLRTSVADFFLPACVDSRHGGYLESWRDGTFVPTGEKFLVLQARQLWTFSTFAAAGVEREKSLAAAKAGFVFLEGHFRDREHGGYFAKVADDGSAPTDPRKHVFPNAFALYGLSAYHRASGDPDALTAAQELFRVLEAKAHDSRNGGYVEFFSRDWCEITDPAELSYIVPAGFKSFNTHLHVMEALAELYRVWPDPSVRGRLEEALEINTLTIRLPEYGCNVDRFTPDWRPVLTEQNLRASYGHDVEGAWLCLDAALALGRPPGLLRGWAEGVVGYSLRHGYDRAHGGFFNAGPAGGDADDMQKVWWVQAEALVAMLEMYRLTGRPEFFDAFARTLEFVERHQIAPGGGWFSTRKADGSPGDDTRASMWHGAYHTGRSLLRCSRVLDEMAGRPAQPPERSNPR